MKQDQMQFLRTLDKFDKLGKDGVVDLLKKPVDEFGANLTDWQASLVGEYLECSSLDELESWFIRANQIRSRFDVIIMLEETGKFDELLAMRQNENNTWENGGRPANIAFCLDDIAELLKKMASINRTALAGEIGAKP